MFAETDVWVLADEWGPEKVVQVYDPGNGMSGVLGGQHRRRTR